MEKKKDPEKEIIKVIDLANRLRVIILGKNTITGYLAIEMVRQSLLHEIKNKNKRKLAEKGLGKIALKLVISSREEG